MTNDRYDLYKGASKPNWMIDISSNLKLGLYKIGAIKVALLIDLYDYMIEIKSMYDKET